MNSRITTTVTLFTLITDLNMIRLNADPPIHIISMSPGAALRD